MTAQELSVHAEGWSIADDDRARSIRELVATHPDWINWCHETDVGDGTRYRQRMLAYVSAMAAFKKLRDITLSSDSQLRRNAQPGAPHAHALPEYYLDMRPLVSVAPDVGQNSRALEGPLAYLLLQKSRVQVPSRQFVATPFRSIWPNYARPRALANDNDPWLDE